jgi:hypothetical protein
VDVREDPFPPNAVWTVDVQGVSLYITCSVAVQGVSMSTAAAVRMCRV